MKRVAILLVLVAVACGRMPGSDEPEFAAADPEVVDAVLDGILERLGTEYVEHGPEFVHRLPQVKEEVVVANGFKDWSEFSERVRILSPERDLWISRQITTRMEELLETPYTPPAKTAEPEDEE